MNQEYFWYQNITSVGNKFECNKNGITDKKLLQKLSTLTSLEQDKNMYGQNITKKEKKNSCDVKFLVWTNIEPSKIKKITKTKLNHLRKVKTT